MKVKTKQYSVEAVMHKQFPLPCVIQKKTTLCTCTENKKYF